MARSCRRSVPRAGEGANVAIELDEGVDVGCLVGGRSRAEALDGRAEQGRNAREPERTVEEAGDGDIVGGNQRGRGPLADSTGVPRDPERGKADLVRGPEFEPARRDQ